MPTCLLQPAHLFVATRTKGGGANAVMPPRAGYGFVTYSTEEQARAAIEALSNQCVLSPGSRPLVVKFAEGLQQVCTRPSAPILSPW